MTTILGDFAAYLRQVSDNEKHSSLADMISCKIFEHFALQTDPVTEFIKLRSAHSKKAPLGAKTCQIRFPFGETAPAPLKLDPVNLIQIHSYFVLYKDVS